MNKLKSNKGITLVALIITVIVLLILTVVAIRAITEEGVLDKAKTATNQYEDKRRQEENMLGNYAAIIDANMPQNTTAEGNGGEEPKDNNQSGDDNTEERKYYVRFIEDGSYKLEEVFVLTKIGDLYEIEIFQGIRNEDLLFSGRESNVMIGVEGSPIFLEGDTLYVSGLEHNLDLNFDTSRLKYSTET